MTTKKRALGRGLDSLIHGGTGTGAATGILPPDPEAIVAQITDHRRVIDIPLAQLRPNLNQPRTVFDEEQIEELAASIREKGVLMPLLVRRAPEGYEIIAGERRFRASQRAGLQNVPGIVVEVNDEASLEIALIENLQRADLNSMEEARAYKSLMDQFHLSQEEVAARVGKKRSTVANALRLLQLPLDIQEDLYENRLTAGHARAILSLSDAPKQRNLRNLILAKGISVREAEAAAKRMGEAKPPRPPKTGAVEVQMRNLMEELSMKIGLQVYIRPVSNSAGKVEIQYQSLDDFEILCEFFGIEKS